jgi:integrase
MCGADPRQLCDAHGDKPVALMEQRHVRRIRDEKAELPEAANAIPKALRAVLRNGVQAELVSRNPAEKSPLALAQLLYTAQRRSDVARLDRQHIRKDGWLYFTQYKNRNRKPVTMELPILPALQCIIDASARGDMAFLVSERGTPSTADSFGNRFRIWCRQAGLDHCSAHGLRKPAAARLTEQTASKVSHPGAAAPEWDENSPQLIEEKGAKSWMVPRGGIEPPTLRFSVKC